MCIILQLKQKGRDCSKPTTTTTTTTTATTTTTTSTSTTTTTTAPPPSPPPPPAITTTTVSRGVSPEHGYSKCCSYHRPMLGPWLLQIQDVRTIGPRRQLCDLWVAPLPPPRLPLVSRLEMIDGMTVTKWAALLHLALVYTMEISYSSVLLAGSTLVCILDERKTEREKEREKERGRGRDRETERQRQTDRQTDRQADRQRQRQSREREGERGRQVGNGYKRHSTMTVIGLSG